MEALGNMMICNPLDTSARAQAMGGILCTEEILAKLSLQHLSVSGNYESLN
jgi:hypothetical protein